MKLMIKIFTKKLYVTVQFYFSLTTACAAVSFGGQFIQ